MSGHHHHPTSLHNARWAFYVNLLLVILEVFAAVYSQSLSILSNAIHDLGDCLSIGATVFFEKLAHRPADDRFNYGYKRFSLLGSLVTGLVLFISSIFILVEAADRIHTPHATKGSAMFVFSLIGMALNLAGWLRLRFGKTQSEKMLTLHFVEDILGWVAVFIGAIILWLTNWIWIDTVFAVGIALYVIYNAVLNLKTTLYYFLQGKPRDLNLQQMRVNINRIEGVSSVRSIKAWSLDGHDSVIEARINLSKLDDLENIVAQAKKELLQHGVQHASIEIEASK